MRRRGERDRSAGEALWRFSLALYSRPSVAEALLALQDRAGRDANLVLFAVWVGATQGRRLDPTELAAAVAVVAPLNTALVQPLRQLRRELKTAGDGDVRALRRRVLGLELAAEQRLQRRLKTAAGLPSLHEPSFAAAEANLFLALGDDIASAEAAVLRRALASLMRAT